MLPRTPVPQGFRGAIGTVRGAALAHIVDSVDGRFEDNLANHAATARAIGEGDSKNAAMP